MTRISSLFVASALAVLPISAFAQQNAAPAKNATPTSMAPAATATPATPPASVGGKMSDTSTPSVTQPAKTKLTTPAHGAKTEVHGMNGVKSHVVQPNATSSTAPTKTDAATKS